MTDLPCYSVARELQDQPDRFGIIKDQPNITKREAVALRQERSGKPHKPPKPKADSFQESVQKTRAVLLEVANIIDRETVGRKDDEIDPESELALEPGQVDPDPKLAEVFRVELDLKWLRRMQRSFERGLRYCAMLKKVLEPEPEHEEPGQEQPPLALVA